jgi:hypothetical protein
METPVTPHNSTFCSSVPLHFFLFFQTHSFREDPIWVGALWVVGLGFMGPGKVRTRKDDDDATSFPSCKEWGLD